MPSTGIELAKGTADTALLLTGSKASLKWIIFKLSDDYTEVEVDETSDTADWAVFREKLINSKSKDKKGNDVIGGRYGLFDMKWDSGEGIRSKIVFIAWVPDDAPQYPRMMYSATKVAFKNAIRVDGLIEIQANDQEEIEYDSVFAKVSKGR